MGSAQGGGTVSEGPGPRSPWMLVSKVTVVAQTPQAASAPTRPLEDPASQANTAPQDLASLFHAQKVSGR